MLRPALTLAAILSTGLAAASVHAPRVISPHRADAYSMKTFRDFHRWRDLSGDALAYEVYKYLVDYESGVFHMNEVIEGDDVLSEFVTIRDPVKIINVYGYGYCGIFGPTMAGVMEGMGVGPTRTLVIPDWNHVASEAYYEDAWHYLDLDVRAVFRRPDGTLASMAEAKTDDALWQGERNELFFPNDPLGNVQETYRNTDVLHFNSHHQSGHTLDFVLRQGETFTRWWHPQDGRWNHTERWNESEWLTNLIASPPRGPKPNHRHFTVHNHANGQFIYAPDLTDQSTDFADGVYDSENVATAADGLKATGEGYAVFEVRSPYIIVPRVGDTKTTDDDREASVVTLDADGVSLSVSLDNGLTWADVAEDPDNADLTGLVSGRYGYLLRLDMADDAIVRSMRIETWTQVAPAALPALEQGANRMELRTGDHHGMDSRVVEISASAGDPGELLKYCVDPPADLDTERKTARLIGAVHDPRGRAPERKNRLAQHRRRVPDAPTGRCRADQERNTLRRQPAHRLHHHLHLRRAHRPGALALQRRRGIGSRRTGRDRLLPVCGRSSAESDPYLRALHR